MSKPASELNLVLCAFLHALSSLYSSIPLLDFGPPFQVPHFCVLCDTKRNKKKKRTRKSQDRHKKEPNLPFRLALREVQQNWAFLVYSSIYSVALLSTHSITFPTLSLHAAYCVPPVIFALFLLPAYFLSGLHHPSWYYSLTHSSIYPLALSTFSIWFSVLVLCCQNLYQRFRFP